MDIRQAQPADLDAAMRIIQGCIAKMESQGIHQWDAVYPDRRRLQSDLDGGTLFVGADASGGVAAVMALDEEQSPAYADIDWQWRDGRVLVVHRLAVSPDCQGRGLAGRMMDFAEQVARQRGCGLIRLDAFVGNAAAQRLYARLG